MVTMYYRGSCGAVVVYDITNDESFGNVSIWINELRQSVPSIPIAIVGNKSDLKDQRKIDTTRLTKLAEDLNIPVALEVSAKTGENIRKAFWELAIRLRPVERSETPRIRYNEEENDDEEKQEEGSCC